MTHTVSVIIPAHNEEKMIEKSLGKILKLDYPNVEVLVCLDGCTDGTERVVSDVVSKYKTTKKVIIIKNKERLGKAATIMKLLKAATGEIIILNDADWKLVSNKEEFSRLIECFDNPKVGGVHLGTTLSFIENIERTANIKSTLYLGNAWSCILTTRYQKEKFTKNINGTLYADKNKMLYPFMIDIFIKDLVENVHTTCDDGEFTYQILQKGYEVAVLEEGYPRFEDMNRILTVKDVTKTKIRGEAGRKILAKEIDAKFSKFYFEVFIYMLSNILKVKTLRAKIGLLAWISLTVISLGLSKLWIRRSFSAKELWSIKVRRA
jgi:glycosyltransferase involved in cell wall biosynthesis